jgi:hypothetical protein
MEFIAVHFQGKEIMINADWIEMVSESDDGSCTMYLSLCLPNSDDQDYLKPEESYQDIKRMLWR